MKKGLIFVVSAPAGTGKTTLVKMLAQEFNHISRSISYTTRAIRPGETADRDYHYISRNDFEEKIRKDEFLEYAKVFDHYYGTSRAVMEEKQKQGKHIVLVIDTQGAMSLRDSLKAVFIFVCPPSEDSLKTRLLRRKTDSPEEIEKRLLQAKKEMDFAPLYDYQIVNDDLEVAYDALRSIVIAEECRNR